MMPLGEGLLKGISTQHLSEGITFYVNESPVKPVVSGQTKPLLLMLPWLGSRPRAQLKYCEIYLRTGFDVLKVETNSGHFLWPRWGLEYSAQVLRLLESERFSQRPIVVHAISIGAYTFAQHLIHIARDTRRYRGLIDRVRGQIYDSLVFGSLELISAGVSKNLGPYLESLVKHTILLYLRVFKQQTVDYINASVDVFMNTPVTSPVLHFFCGNDVLSDPEALQNLLEHWRKRGISVMSKKWEESEHTGHLRIHPQEYRAVLEHFLCSLNMAPLKAKM
ncbi:uncharacterized protein LOC132887427 [Neoarius graeffei]|uniref:uncharacterized protein LOC132887427 n=1 Tax=Neoarius graeffei TaxID=443677 RepID=UPI00298C89C4|nr:uncharacterized protein LOC132887427 [Neoarius graeffei]